MASALLATLGRQWDGNKTVTVAVLLVVFVSLYSLLWALYSLTIGPVARIPGPALRAVSYIPFALASSKGRAPFDVRGLHRQYGPVVRVHPSLVSFNISAAWNDIYGQKSNTAHQKQSYTRLRPGVQDILTADQDAHARQRHAFSMAFSEKALRGQEPMIQSHINRLVSQLEHRARNGAHNVLNMSQWMDFVTFDIVGELALDTHFKCLENGDYHPWVRLLIRFFKSVAYVVNAKLMGILFPLLMLFAPLRDLQGGKDHIRMSAESVRGRLKADTPNNQDLWSYVLRHNEKNERASAMSPEEMEINAAIILPAGSETMSSALSAALFLLSKNPDVKSRLYGELKAAVKTEKGVTVSSVSGLTYLHAVLNETLRMYPPFPASLQRKVPRGGTTVAGWSIDAGIYVTVFQLSLYTSESNFARPHVFAPERWLPEVPSWAVKDDREAFAPFSMGPRNCIGKALAFAEMKLILARLLLRFEFDLQDDGFELERQRVYIVRDKPALNMRVRLREDA